MNSESGSSGATRRPPLQLYLHVLLDLLGFGLLLPLLPFWIQDQGRGAVMLGLVLSAYSATQFIASPLLGRLSDRIGRRPVLLLCLGVSGLSMVLVANAHAVWMVCVARALAGCFGGTIATAQSYVADCTDDADRTRWLGLLGAAIGISFVLGPALGVVCVVLGLGLNQVAAVAGGLAALNWMIALFRLEESPRIRARERADTPLDRLEISGYQGTVRHLLLANFLMTATFVTLETAFPFFGAERFDLDATGFGLVMFGIGMVLVLVQGGAVGRASRRFGDRPVAVGGALAMAIAFVGLLPATTLWVTLPPLALLALGRGLLTPTLTSMLTKAATASRRGAALGSYQSMAAAARALIPPVSGFLYDVGSLLPFVFGGLLATLCWLSLLRARNGTEESSRAAQPGSR